MRVCGVHVETKSLVPTERAMGGTDKRQGGALHQNNAQFAFEDVNDQVGVHGWVEGWERGDRRARVERGATRSK